MTARRGRRRPVARRSLLAIGSAAALALGACGAVTAPSAGATGSTTPGSLSPPGSLPVSLPAASPAAIDPSLLDLLPATVDGAARTIDPASEEAFRSDPTLAAMATAFATAVYRGPNGAVVLALPIRLRDRALSDAAFRDFRDTYGAAVCAGAGGLVGAADTTVAARQVSVSRCAAGALVYYVRLSGPGVLLVVDAPQGPGIAEDLIGRLGP